MAEPIRTRRGPGGEVEVKGHYDRFAASILARAGFLTFPTLRGQWVRLPFDLGRDWENEHAAWAAQMLTAARYRVHLDPDLHAAVPGPAAPTGSVRPVTAAAATPGCPPRRRS